MSGNLVIYLKYIFQIFDFGKHIVFKTDELFLKLFAKASQFIDFGKHCSWTVYELFAKQFAKASQTPTLANIVFKTNELFAKQLAKASQSTTLANIVHEHMFCKLFTKVFMNFLANR